MLTKTKTNTKQTQTQNKNKNKPKQKQNVDDNVCQTNSKVYQLKMLSRHCRYFCCFSTGPQSDPILLKVLLNVLSLKLDKKNGCGTDPKVCSEKFELNLWLRNISLKNVQRIHKTRACSFHSWFDKTRACSFHSWFVFGRGEWDPKKKGVTIPPPPAILTMHSPLHQSCRERSRGLFPRNRNLRNKLSVERDGEQITMNRIIAKPRNNTCKLSPNRVIRQDTIRYCAFRLSPRGSNVRHIWLKVIGTI